MKILFISAGSKKYGGKVYEEMIKNVLAGNFEVENENFFSQKDFLFKIFGASKRKNIDLVVRNFDASLFLNPKPVKNVVIVHHIDYSFAPTLMKFVSFFFTPLILNNLRKVDAIVTVSKFWENYFKEKGYKNTFLIYNAFNLDDFEFSPEEIEEFKKKHNLTGKPIIYLGNCQKAKGVVESYQALKKLDAHLVTSGGRQVKTPARNLEIPHREYLKLLKASDIVLTMSKFKEGWCRVAHEAMLLKTPVIGSGKGGMRELLEGGKQIICEDFSLLRKKVEYLLNHLEVREKMGQDGYSFARNFTIEKFEKNWLELIKKLI